jgi:GntR family transcriptional regulator of arabinose operon
MGKGEIKYQRILEHLRHKILSGQLQTGDLLPSERELMAEFGVSRQTIRVALASLEKDELIDRRRGLGTTAKLPPVERNGTGKPGDIGILASGLDENYSMPLIRAIDERIRRENYSMLLANCPDPFSSNMDPILSMLKRNIEGLMIFPIISKMQDHAYRFLSDTGVPFVFVDGLVQCVDADCITTDNFAGAYQGAASMIRNGAKRIAYLGISSMAWTARERLSGFQKAVWDSGLEVDRSLIFEGYYEKPFLSNTIRNIMERTPAVDGIFFANHPLTEIAFEIMREKPLPGQDHLLIASFDAPRQHPGLFERPIVSVRQPAEKIGIAAAEAMLKRISDLKQEPEKKHTGRHIQILPSIETIEPN